MDDGLKIKSLAFTALQKFPDYSKVEIQSLTIIVNELGAAAEDVKDHCLNVSFINVTVFQTFLDLFILFLSYHHIFC
jgi:hypothetical protein